MMTTSARPAAQMMRWDYTAICTWMGNHRGRHFIIAGICNPHTDGATGDGGSGVHCAYLQSAHGWGNPPTPSSTATRPTAIRTRMGQPAMLGRSSIGATCNPHTDGATLYPLPRRHSSSLQSAHGWGNRNLV